MSPYERDQLIGQILEQALDFGFSDAEVYASGGHGIDIRMRGGVAENYAASATDGISFRGTWKGKMGFAVCEPADSAAITWLLREAAANAELVDDPDPDFLYAAEPAEAELSVEAPADPDAAEFAPSEMIRLAAELEQVALTSSPDVRKLDTLTLWAGRGERLIRNTLGLNLRQADALLSAGLYLIGERDSQVKTNGVLWQGRRWQDLNVQAIGREAAARTEEMLGARQVPSGRKSVVLDNRCATDLIQTFLPTLSAERVQKGFSPLEATAVGQTVAAECVTLTDRPEHPDSFYRPAFDSEGVRTRSKTLIEQGQLQTFLHHLKSARKAGVASTGNGFRSGLRAPIQIAAACAAIEPGSFSLAELLREMGDGLLITDLSGLHAGANAVSGDFSLLAEGFVVRGGEKQEPVEQITVAGNFFQFLRSIQAVGKDIYFSWAGAGQTASPSLFAESLTIGGS